MENFKLQFNRLIFYIRRRIHFFLFIISLISFFIVFLNIIRITNLLNITSGTILFVSIHLAFLFSTIYILLFLPFYPLYFIIFKEKEFNSLEKLGLTIISNLCFYIISAYIGYLLNFAITSYFFFIILLGLYFSLVIYVIIQEKKNERYVFLNSKNLDYSNIKYEDFSLVDYIKKKVPPNTFLLILFIFLICIFNVVRFEFFFGTDPWLHIFIAKEIVEMNFLPVGEYYGSIGLPIFAAVLHFFSGLDFILIPKFFIFYTIPVSALVFYNILMRIFKNYNLAFLGVFILEFSGLGFAYMMYQFWPTHLAVILCLGIFFLLYVRLQNYVKQDRPKIKEIYSGISFNYILISFLFVTALLIHVLTCIIFLLSFIWIYLIFFIKDYKRGFDFILLSGLLGVFILFINFGLTSEHFYFVDRVELPTFSLLLIFACVGLAIFGVILVWRLQKSILFSTGRFSKTAKGEQDSYYKYIDDKIIIPLALTLIVVLTLILTIGNLLILKLPVTIIFSGIEIMIFVILTIWGLIIFQKKPRGKLFLLWGIFFGFFFLSVFIIDILTINKNYWGRIFFLTSPLVVIGFISYIYKQIKAKTFHTKRFKYFLLFIITFSLFTTYFHEYTTVQYVSLTRRQVGGAQWYSEHTSDKNVIISEFGFNYMFYYYDYPYDQKNKNIDGRDTNYYLDTKDNDYYLTDEHINDDENELQELKKDKETDVIITLDDQYYYNKDWKTYQYLSEDDMDEYYEAEYLNKIYSAKSENGKENAIYWVI